MPFMNGLIFDASGGSGGGTGDVVGPSSSTDNAVARFDSTTGKIIQNSSCTIDDNGRLQTGNGANGGVNLGGAGARISDSNNDGRLDFIAGGSSRMDLVDVGGGQYRFRVTSGAGMSVSSVRSLTNIDWNGDTDLYRHAARVLKLTDVNGNNISGFIGGGASVASATAMPVPTGRVFHVTGTTDITSITATNLQSGVVITLIFDDSLRITDGSNLKLAGDFITATGDTITLAFDGTNFYEVCRSVKGDTI